MITAERLRDVLDYDASTGVFTWRTDHSSRAPAGRIAGGLAGNQYIRIKVDGTKYMAHRLAWLYTYGVWPTDQVDHRDEDKLNNRLSNLREASNGQNQSNLSRAYRNGTTGYQGVTFNKFHQRYQAQIQVDGRKRHIGYFDTAEQAHEAYKLMKGEMHPFWTDVA